MSKKIVGLIFGLIIIASSIVIFTVSTYNPTDFDDENEEVTTGDILDEIDESLLDGDDEIEIGEIV